MLTSLQILAALVVLITAGAAGSDLISPFKAATKNIFRGCHAATALTKTAVAIHTPTQKRLRQKTRRISRWRMLKRMIWRMRG